MKHPTATITFIDGHWDIDVDNWEGVSAVAIERLSQELHRVCHKERAKRLLQWENERKEKAASMVAEVAAGRKTDEDNQLIEELENVLK